MKATEQETDSLRGLVALTAGRLAQPGLLSVGGLALVAIQTSGRIKDPGEVSLPVGRRSKRQYGCENTQPA